MSYTPPEICSWEDSCLTYDCEETGGCLTVHVSDGPNGNSHQIASNYSVNVAGVSIPVVKTVRNFNVVYSQQFGDPGKPDSMFINANGDFQALVCKEYPPNSPALTVTEDCVIEKSILQYLDQRYGVCLYRYQKDELHMAVGSSEMAAIKGVWGMMYFHQAQIKTNSYTATRTVEWRLIVEGVEEILKSTVTELEPFGPRNNGKSLRENGTTEGLFLDYHPDPETRLVLLFPTPPSMGIPWSEVICRLGCYEFGYDTPEGTESVQNRLDGGNKDHFYPEWCRNLQEDPFWRKAADNRYLIDWFHFGLTDDTGYIPPAVTTDPLPAGSYVKHPQAGEAYQFLVDGDTVKTNPDFNALIDEALPDGEETHDTTLYYPIGVI